MAEEGLLTFDFNPTDIAMGGVRQGAPPTAIAERTYR